MHYASCSSKRPSELGGSASTLEESLVPFLTSDIITLCTLSNERITTEDDVSEYEEHKAELKEQENFLPEEYGIEVKKELEEKEQDAASKKEKVTLIKKNPSSKTVTEKQQTGEKEAHAEAHAGPSHEEMWDMVTGLLKEVKFDVVTFSDILKRLEANFNTSLSNRKAEIRSLIKEAITSMTDDEEEEDEDDEEEEDAKGGNRVG
ncbi:hypothetical protein AAC387_Pa02g3859 [Persea americana]